MARSIKKGPYVAAHLEDKVVAINDGKSKKGVIKTWSRRSTITPDFVGHTFAVWDPLESTCRHASLSIL